MQKRIIYITLLLLLIGAFAYFYTQINKHSEQGITCDISEIVPSNAGIILEIPQLNDLLSHSNLDSDMWQTLLQLDGIQELTETWQNYDTLSLAYPNLKNWSKCPAVISYHISGQSAVPFIAFKFSNKAKVQACKELIADSKLTQVKMYSGIKILKLSSEDERYCFFHDGYLVASTSTVLLEQSIRIMQGQLKTDATLEAIQKTKGSGANINIFVNYDRLNQIIANTVKSNSSINKRISHLGQWGEYDFNIDENNIILNGFSSYKIEDYWKVFSNQKNAKMSLYKVIPSNSKGYFTITLSDIKTFRSDYVHYINHTGRLNKYNAWLRKVNKQGAMQVDVAFDSIINKEIALRFDDLSTQRTDESLVIIKTKSASTAKERLTKLASNYTLANKLSTNELKRTISLDDKVKLDIYSLPIDNLFEHLYGEVFAGVNTSYYSFYDNYIFFGASTKIVKEAIMDNLLKQTLVNNSMFMDIFDSFTDKSTIFYFEKTINILDNLAQNTSNDFCTKNGLVLDRLNNMYATSYQMVNSGEHVYNSILLNYNADVKDTPLTVWNSQLDAPVIGKPCFVKNHYSNENEICVQDEDFNLYLISTSGIVIWKKPIGEKILGDIHQVDYFRNGKLQLLFNTASKLIMFDRNGNFVSRYPILLPSKASTGLSLFDYDKSRNYRIFIPTVDKHLYLFSKEGNINKGFTFNTTEYPLTTPIQHFRVASKDYLCFADINHMYILDRKGNTRIKLKEQFAASKNNQFYTGNLTAPHFVTTNNVGDIVKVYMDGRVTFIDLPDASSNHYFAVNKIGSKQDDHYIVVDKDQLIVYNHNGKKIYDQTIEGAELSAPYFYEFASNDIKIGLLNKTNNEIYLFNGNDGSVYKDFPLVGSTPFTIGFLDKSNWRFNLLVGGENESLYNYKVK